MKFRIRTHLSRTERVGFRIGAAGLGFALGRIAQELLIELFYPSHGSTVPNVIRLLPFLNAATPATEMSPEMSLQMSLALLYVPVVITGLLSAAAQLLSYRCLAPGQKPSTPVLVSTALLASLAHALMLWPTHHLLGEPRTFLLSAAAVKAAMVIVYVAARSSKGWSKTATAE